MNRYSNVPQGNEPEGYGRAAFRHRPMQIYSDDDSFGEWFVGYGWLLIKPASGATAMGSGELRIWVLARTSAAP